MIRFQAFLFCFFISLVAKADMPGPAFQYDLYSQNGKFYFKSIPFHNLDETNFGKSIVYDARSQRKLYQVNNYLPKESFISNNGQSLITTRYWMWGHDDFDDQPLVTIFRGNKQVLHFFVGDIIKDRSKLRFTSSHTLWYENMYIHNDTLFLITLDHHAVLIEVNQAKILGRMNKSFLYQRFGAKLPTPPRRIVYSKIKYLPFYSFPNLVNGAEFKQALKAALNKQEVESYEDCRYYISVSGIIDRKGNCEIFMLSASVDGAENPDWTRQVRDWITRQKYKTELIPVNCDKWVFEEYFYLR